MSDSVVAWELDRRKSVFYEGHKVQDSIRLGGDCPFCFLCSTGPVIKPNLNVICGGMIHPHESREASLSRIRAR